MLNKLGKKICAGVGAFITVFGSNALSNAMQTKEKAIQNAAETAGNVNRNSGGYSSNGALLSTRTLLEIFTVVDLLVIGCNQRKRYLESFEDLKAKAKKLIDNNPYNEYLSKVRELENDKKMAKQIINFLQEIVSVSDESALSHLSNWYDWDQYKKKYDFVPHVVDNEFCQVLGVFNLARACNKPLKKLLPDIGKERWDLNLNEEEIKKIVGSNLLLKSSLSMLDNLKLCKGVLGKEENNIFDSTSGLRRFNGNVSIRFGENCKRVFSKITLDNKGCFLCEGFIMKYGNCHDKGLVLRFTYGDLVEKVENK